MNRRLAPVLARRARASRAAAEPQEPAAARGQPRVRRFASRRRARVSSAELAGPGPGVAAGPGATGDTADATGRAGGTGVGIGREGAGVAATAVDAAAVDAVGAGASVATTPTSGAARSAASRRIADRAPPSPPARERRACSRWSSCGPPRGVRGPCPRPSAARPRARAGQARRAAARCRAATAAAPAPAATARGPCSGSCVRRSWTQTAAGVASCRAAGRRPDRARSGSFAPSSRYSAGVGATRPSVRAERRVPRLRLRHPDRVRAARERRDRRLVHARRHLREVHGRRAEGRARRGPPGRVEVARRAVGVRRSRPAGRCARRGRRTPPRCRRSPRPGTSSPPSG